MSRRNSGISIIEVVLFGSLAAGLFLWIAPWIAKPTIIQQKLLAALDERKALRATDALINDLKRMMPGSLNTEFLPHEGPLTFLISAETTEMGELPSAPSGVSYVYQLAKSGETGALYRVTTTTPAVILDGLLVSEPTSPLFHYDPELKIVTIDLRWKQPERPILRVVRRVSLPN